MRSVFEIIDNWKFRGNLFRDVSYLQKICLIFVASMGVAWVLLGYDSGVGMLEVWSSNGAINVAEYGKSLHFSAFVIYGLLYFGLSKHLQNLGISGSRNVFYSASLSLLNISIFEWWYMGSFAHFQMNRNLLEWFISDFWFLYQYLLVLILGLLSLLAVYVDSHIVMEKIAIGRYFMFKVNYKMLICFTLTLIGIVVWVFYPFPIVQATINDWTSNVLFPQTHYAYVDAELYIANDLLHTVNISVKALFAITQYIVLRGFRKVEEVS